MTFTLIITHSINVDSIITNGSSVRQWTVMTGLITLLTVYYWRNNAVIASIPLAIVPY